MPSCPNCGDEVALNATTCPTCDFCLTHVPEEEQAETGENTGWHLLRQWAVAFGMALALAITMTTMSVGSNWRKNIEGLYVMLGLETFVGGLLLYIMFCMDFEAILKIVVVLVLVIVLLGLNMCSMFMTTPWG